MTARSDLNSLWEGREERAGRAPPLAALDPPKGRVKAMKSLCVLISAWIYLQRRLVVFIEVFVFVNILFVVHIGVQRVVGRKEEIAQSHGDYVSAQ